MRQKILAILTILPGLLVIVLVTPQILDNQRDIKISNDRSSDVDKFLLKFPTGQEITPGDWTAAAANDWSNSNIVISPQSNESSTSLSIRIAALEVKLDSLKENVTSLSGNQTLLLITGILLPLICSFGSLLLAPTMTRWGKELDAKIK